MASAEPGLADYRPLRYRYSGARHNSMGIHHLPNLCRGIFHRPPGFKTKKSIREHKCSMVQTLALDGFVDSELATLEYMKRRGFKGACLIWLRVKLRLRGRITCNCNFPRGSISI
jgi:hypothetical protein